MVQQKETLQDIALRELAWYRCLTLQQILQLSGFGSERHAREQLHVLAEKEYVFIRTPDLSKGRLPRVYQLLPKGKAYLKKKGIDVPYYVQTLQELDTEKKIFPTHTIGVNDVFIMLHLLTVHYPDRFQILRQIHEREMGQYLSRKDGETDGFFLINVNHNGIWKKQSAFLEYERTTAKDIERFRERIRKILLLFDNVSKLEMLFGVKNPYYLSICDSETRARILADHCARVLQDLKRTDWESRFLFSFFDPSLSPVQFFCAPRWLRAWLPIPPAVPSFTDQEDLLPSVS